MNGICVLIKEATESSLAPLVMGGHSKKTAIYDPGIGLLPDTKYAQSSGVRATQSHVSVSTQNFGGQFLPISAAGAGHQHQWVQKTRAISSRVSGRQSFHSSGLEEDDRDQVQEDYS